MAATSPQTHHRAKVPALCLRRFTEDEYHRMVETGILEEDDPVESARSPSATCCPDARILSQPFALTLSRRRRPFSMMLRRTCPPI
jgi:hypothetical protein